MNRASYSHIALVSEKSLEILRSGCKGQIANEDLRKSAQLSSTRQRLCTPCDLLRKRWPQWSVRAVSDAACMRRRGTKFARQLTAWVICKSMKASVDLAKANGVYLQGVQQT